MAIMVRGELRARPGRRAEFLAVVAALAAEAASEPGTLRYDWYHGEGEDEFVVLEEYADPAAAVAHNQHCAELLARVPELADMTAVRLHGDLGPDLAGWVEEHPIAHAHPPLDLGGHAPVG